MAETYGGINGKARRIVKAYVGINGIAREIKSGYGGVNNIARKIFSSESESEIVLGPISSASLSDDILEWEDSPNAEYYEIWASDDEGAELIGIYDAKNPSVTNNHHIARVSNYSTSNINVGVLVNSNIDKTQRTVLSNPTTVFSNSEAEILIQDGQEIMFPGSIETKLIQGNATFDPLSTDKMDYIGHPEPDSTNNINKTDSGDIAWESAGG